MKKLAILCATIMLSIGMWAEKMDGVKYLETYGIERIANNVTVIENATEPVTWYAGWYIVTGADVQLAKGAICQGAVYLILADDAKLTTTGIDDISGNTYSPGIQVSGEGCSLTIYGQSAQSGQLIANGGRQTAGIGGQSNSEGCNITINGGNIIANGGGDGAGIGGGQMQTGLNITINGGTVTAYGGYGAAGIGGGAHSYGTNITINKGFVTAIGGQNADGIGNANQIPAGTEVSKNIFVYPKCIVKAGDSANPTYVIENDGSDLADQLNDKCYVTILDERTAAYTDGFAAGCRHTKAELPTDPEGTAGTVVTITKDEKTLQLINPDKVSYGKVTE